MESSPAVNLQKLCIFTETTIYTLQHYLISVPAEYQRSAKHHTTSSSLGLVSRQERRRSRSSRKKKNNNIKRISYISFTLSSVKHNFIFFNPAPCFDPMTVELKVYNYSICNPRLKGLHLCTLVTSCSESRHAHAQPLTNSPPGHYTELGNPARPYRQREEIQQCS